MKSSYVSALIVFCLIVILGFIGFDYVKNKENITENNLLFEVKVGNLDCESVRLKVYDDNTYKYYYSVNSEEYLTGKYTYEVTNLIKDRNKNKINNGLYILTDKYGKEYEVNGINEDLNNLLKEINIELDTCLIDIEESLGDDYLNISYQENYKYTIDTYKTLIYFYKYNHNDKRYEKIKTYEYDDTIASVRDDNNNGKYTFNINDFYLYVILEDNVFESFTNIFPINNDNNDYRYMVVYKDKKFGLIDTFGKYIHDLKYAQIGTFNNTDRFESSSYIYNEMIIAKKNGLWGIIKIDENREIVDFKYDNIFLVNDDIYLVQDENNLYVKRINDKDYTSDKMKINIFIKYPNIENIDFGLENYYVKDSIGLDYYLENEMLVIKLKKDYDSNENYDIYHYNVLSNELLKISE